MDLTHLNGKKASVTLPIRDRVVTVVGWARCETDSELGNIVRIAIADKSADIVIQSSRWDGTVSPNANSDCDFVVHLTACALAAR